MADKTVTIFKALADKTRVEMLRDFLDGHESVCPEVKEKIAKSQPTLSHHIRKLVDADIIIETKKGTNCYYKVNIKYLKDLGFDIKKIVSN